ncbi:MAG: glycosyltransferase family 39 protein [Rhodopirellula sp.]|nr:glycosyltransferase family 39 protein [Rhodopirellula sp.]
MSRENDIEKKSARIPAIVWILLLACQLRSAAVTVRFENLQVDRDSYLKIAQNLVNGNGYCSTVGQPTAYRPPLYPLLVAVCIQMGGTIALAIVQILLGTATVWLTWLLAERCRFSRRTGLLSAVLVAVDPLLIEYTTQAMTETFSTFLVTLLLVVILQDGREQSRGLLVGIVFGMAALCRPTIWIFGGLAAFGWFLTQWLHPSPSGMPVFRAKSWHLKTACACAAAVAMTVSPWVIRNVCQFGRPILTTTHGGYTLLLGNNEVFFREVVAPGHGATWNAASLSEWQAENERHLKRMGIAETDEVSRDAGFSRLAEEWIVNNPLKFVRACRLRFQRFWAIRPSVPAGFPALLVQFVGAYYLGNFVLAAVGGFRSRQMWRKYWVLPAMVLALTLVHLVYWSNARMRSAIVPVISLAVASAFQRPGYHDGSIPCEVATER